MGTRSDNGSLWAVISSATASYPTDGRGGVTTSATVNIFTATTGSGTSKPSGAMIDGLLITAKAADATITIFAMDGTTALQVVTITSATQLVPMYIPLGGPNGLSITGGFSFATSNVGTTAYVYFRTAP